MKDVFVLFNIYRVCYFINARVGISQKKKKGIKAFQIKMIPFALQKKHFLKTGDNSVQKFHTTAK